MKRQSFYPTRQAEQAVWLRSFYEKLPAHAAELGLSEEEVADTVADARWLIYLLTSWLEATRTHGKAVTEALELAQTGTGDKAQVLPVLTAPNLPKDVSPRKTGGLRRIFEVASGLRSNSACTSDMQADLGLAGAEDAGPDPDTLRPAISASLTTTTGVNIAWDWQGWSKHPDQCEIEVDRGDGQGWLLLTIDMKPSYEDKTPAPATLTRWKYRAICRIADVRTGHWSAEAAVTLGGN